MGRDTIVTLVVQPDGFCIRSKKDAERFLTELFAKGGETVVDDVTHRGMPGPTSCMKSKLYLEFVYR